MVSVPDAKKTWGGKINTVTIGAAQPEGGTRTSTVTVGGATTLPFLHFEGASGQPVIAMEVWDIYPEEWPDLLKQPFEDALSDPGTWANKCVEFGADLICLRLVGCDSDKGDNGPEAAVQAVKRVLDAVGVPLIVWGTGNPEVDNEVFPVVAEATTGENCLLGTITEDNYKTLVAACTAYKHKIIAESPCDVNIAKQMNILANDMGFPVEDIVIYPTTGALGYGLEYIYSVMERARLAGLKGDQMLAQPMICDIGIEAWGVKEARTSEEELPEWGLQRERAPLWEAATAVVYLLSGGDLFVLRHPRAVEAVKQMTAQLMSAPATAIA
ncbi:MAG: acetyl-CoA decarbonylase/synthase complex subunit delta [Anaerolineae bacterium]